MLRWAVKLRFIAKSRLCSAPEKQFCLAESLSIPAILFDYPNC